MFLRESKCGCSFSLSAPLEAPLDVGVVLINSTAIKVTWAPVNRETVRGRLLGYKVTNCVVLNSAKNKKNVRCKISSTNC